MTVFYQSVINSNGSISAVAHNDGDIGYGLLTSAGVFDTSMDTDGLKFFDAGDMEDDSNPWDADFTYDDPTAIAKQSDGSLIIGFTSDIYGENYSDFSLMRLSTAGVLDSGSFAYSGATMDRTSDQWHHLRDIAIFPEGPYEDEIVAVGMRGSDCWDFESPNLTDNDIVVMRYDYDGWLEEGNFGGSNGYVVTDIDSKSDHAFGVVAHMNGKITVGGRTYNGTDWDYLFIRYNADGTLDTSFHGDGIYTADGGTSTHDVIKAVDIQSDGSLIGVGDTGGLTGSGVNFMMIRMHW